MAQFKPIMVENIKDLEKIAIKAGQFIIVRNQNEIYLDNTDNIREKISQNIYMSSEEPKISTEFNEGDIWVQIEEEEVSE